MKRIVIIGPESTGKSTLCKGLSHHFKCDYLPEYARTYLEENGSDYQFEDVLKMAKGQYNSDISFCNQVQSEFAIIDTDLLVYKVWIEERYETKNEFVEEVIQTYQADHYFLCDIDLPWEFDALREHPNPEDRKRLFLKYQSHLNELGCSYTVLSGDKKTRLNDAISILTNLI